MKIDNILNPQESLNLRNTLKFTEIPYDASKDVFMKDGIEYPTEAEAEEMLNDSDELELD